MSDNLNLLNSSWVICVLCMFGLDLILQFSWLKNTVKKAGKSIMVMTHDTMKRTG